MTQHKFHVKSKMSFLSILFSYIRGNPCLVHLKRKRSNEGKGLEMNTFPKKSIAFYGQIIKSFAEVLPDRYAFIDYVIFEMNIFLLFLNVYGKKFNLDIK